jgi:hypothetical protein
MHSASFDLLKWQDTINIKQQQQQQQSNMYTRGALQALAGKNGREKHGSTSAQTIGNLKMTLAMLQVLKLHVRLCTLLPCCINSLAVAGYQLRTRVHCCHPATAAGQ